MCKSEKNPLNGGYHSPAGLYDTIFYSPKNKKNCKKIKTLFFVHQLLQRVQLKGEIWKFQMADSMQRMTTAIGEWIAMKLVLDRNIKMKNPRWRTNTVIYELIDMKNWNLANNIIATNGSSFNDSLT